MIRRDLLHHEDFLWALDHSQRQFRVVPLEWDDEGETDLLRIVQMSAGASVVMKARCGLFPDDWEDTDIYASARLNAISMGVPAHRRGGVR